MVKIQQVHNLTPQRVRMLLYGDSGVGKTVHASTWPKPLFIDADDGMASVKVPTDRVFVSSWEETFEVLNWLRENPQRYETIVVDTLNEVQRLIMEYVIAHYPNRRSYDTQPTLPDYGKMIDETMNFVRFFRLLPVHTIFICQVRDREFETDPVQPLLAGKRTAKDVARIVDIVAFLFRGEDGKRIMAFDVPGFVTKDRTGSLPPTIALEPGDGFNRIAEYLLMQREEI